MDVLRSLFLPCGRCAMCRLEQARQWAVRCMHEAKLYEHSCFVTLTYDGKHLPEDLSLRYEDFQKFMKRLRKSREGVRFYMCGEYGSQLGRPHYHALLFNCHFPDQLYFRRTPAGAVYTSAELAKLWPLGNHYIGSVTFASAQYVARYCLERITGAPAQDHYRAVNLETGEVWDRVPEFNQMSRRPGIGARWLEKFMSDVYPRGECVVNGSLRKAPRFYDKMFRRAASSEDEAALDAFRYERAMSVDPKESTDERLAVREQVMLARLALTKREL